MDMIIFSGQSNMQGQCERLSENETVANCYEYKWLSNTLVPLKNPVGENITYDYKEGIPLAPDTNIVEWLETHVTGSACYNYTNLVPEFCRVYSRITSREVIAVHVAKGSTAIAEWLPGTPAYDILTRKVSAAKSATMPNHIFFVWLQGENDEVLGHSKEYYKSFATDLCNALKKDIGIEKFGIIRVGRFAGDARDDEILSAQDELCIENSDFIMLTDIAERLNKQPEYMNPLAYGHYSATGLEKLGNEAAKALADYVMGNKTTHK